MALGIASGLANYVDQLSQPIISRAVLEAQTVKAGKIISGIKYAQQINIMELNPFYVQNNTAANSQTAGFNDSGTTILSAVTLTVCPLKIEQQFFLETLENIWYGQLMKAGSYVESVPSFEEAFMSQLAKVTSQYTDYALWFGGYAPAQGSNAHSADTVGNTGVVSACNGILTNIFNTSQSGSVTTVTYSGTPTVGNIGGIIDAIVAALPDNMVGLPNISIWCKPQYFTFYKQYLKNLNNGGGNYHFDPNSLGSNRTDELSLNIPYSENIILRATPGLTSWAGGASTVSGQGFQGFVCTNDENLLIGVDLENDYEGTDIWYSLDYQQLRTRTKFKIGGNIALATQVVVY
jgi:hypothetical protein